ncbi:NnrU family protein [uncultured Paracoccus sp.]|uniref:NnrU family protein n=1 Tax=uncultured Paracoccus sp. TaxID=189685 RepID=UPI00262E6B64|nr:NnrU family protein [uncultured Paracoccus sp.]
MALLILGVALWWAAHLFKRVAPSARASMGASGKGAVAAALILSILLMVIGYRAADQTIWWAATPMLKGINNLLVLVAFYLFAASGAKSRLGVRLRHPQLIGFSLWAGAHLLTNGDLPSFVLFGGLLLWALVEIVVINRTTGWTQPAHPIPVRKEWTTALSALVVYLVVGLIHGWVGPNPFGA